MWCHMLTLICVLLLVLQSTVKGLISGRLSERHEYKSILLLKDMNGLPYCTGLLIFNAEYVLTSAACSISTLDTVHIYAGVYDSREEEIGMQEGRLEAVVPIEIPGGTPVMVALYRLSTPFEENEFVESATLPESSSHMARAANSGVVAGWGSVDISNTGSGNRKLRKVALDITRDDVSECASLAAIKDAPPGSLFCGGRFKGGGQGGCGADTGAPMFFDDGNICGILVKGACGKPRDYDVYADLLWYADYIKGALTGQSSTVSYR